MYFAFDHNNGNALQTVGEYSVIFFSLAFYLKTMHCQGMFIWAALMYSARISLGTNCVEESNYSALCFFFSYFFKDPLYNCADQV